MKQQVSKFLEFNGKTLVFLAVDGQYWIALKPICEALNVEYTRTFKNVTTDPLFGQLLAEQPMVGADGKTRKMISIPEKWVYGWLTSIQSASPELLQYKKLCYEVLNDYFHGAITGRKELLSQKAKVQLEIDGVFNRMPVDDALTLDRSKKKISQINNQLRAMDIDIMEEERLLFSQ